MSGIIVRLQRRRRQRRLAREVELLREQLREAQAASDLDSEYLLLCMIASRINELDASSS